MLWVSPRCFLSVVQNEEKVGRELHFCTKKVNSNHENTETESNDGVERAKEKQVKSTIQREADYLDETIWDTEQDRRTEIDR